MSQAKANSRKSAVFLPFALLLPTATVSPYNPHTKTIFGSNAGEPNKVIPQSSGGQREPHLGRGRDTGNGFQSPILPSGWCYVRTGVQTVLAADNSSFFLQAIF